MSYCRFKRQISDKPQGTVSRYSKKVQNIVLKSKKQPCIWYRNQIQGCWDILFFRSSMYTEPVLLPNWLTSSLKWSPHCRLLLPLEAEHRLQEVQRGAHQSDGCIRKAHPHLHHRLWNRQALPGSQQDAPPVPPCSVDRPDCGGVSVMLLGSAPVLNAIHLIHEQTNKANR